MSRSFTWIYYPGDIYCPGHAHESTVQVMHMNLLPRSCTWIYCPDDSHFPGHAHESTVQVMLEYVIMRKQICWLWKRKWWNTNCGKKLILWRSLDWWHSTKQVVGFDPKLQRYLLLTAHKKPFKVGWFWVCVVQAEMDIWRTYAHNYAAFTTSILLRQSLSASCIVEWAGSSIVCSECCDLQ